MISKHIKDGENESLRNKSFIWWMDSSRKDGIQAR